ncbi:flagellar hook-basal body complex protein FliE [Desulfobacterota bacterium M19]
MNKLLLTPVSSPGRPAAPSSGPIKTPGSGFGRILEDSVGAVNKQIETASSLSEGLMAGKQSNIHETMIAIEKASLSFHMLTRVQGKVIDAYKEVMRMQL